MQRFQILGRIGQDLELKKTQQGKSTVRISVADSKTIKRPDGTEEKITTWTEWVAWEKIADTLIKYVKKGDMIFLEGEYRNEKYVQQGVEKWRNYFIVKGFQFVPNARVENQQPTQTTQPKPIETPAYLEDADADLFGGRVGMNISPEDLPFY